MGSATRHHARSALIVGQSGGPTAVINASLAGVITAARATGIARILGMRHGVEGLLAEELAELGQLSGSLLSRLRGTPSAFLGSCRYRLSPGDADRIVDILRRHDVRYFVYIGGNDSADSSLRIDQAARQAGFELKVVGVPKTIDNDLPAMDHTPGYGSAARFLVQAVAEAGLDTEAMRRSDPIKLIEVMGRQAGWLAAATWLARSGEATAPHLVYLPERPVAAEQVLQDVQAVYRRLGFCVVVLCENQPDPGGRVLGSVDQPRWIDAFGHAYFDSPAQHLADRIRAALGVRARVEKWGTLQRMSTAHVSAADQEEAEAVGAAAVRLALSGASGWMVTLLRESDEPYRWSTGEVALGKVANRQRTIPDAFIGDDGHSLTPGFERYLRPLLGGPLPKYARL